MVCLPARSHGLARPSQVAQPAAPRVGIACMARASAKSRSKRGSRAARDAESSADADAVMVGAGSEILGLALIAFSLLASLALATYSSADPIGRLVEVENGAGPVGATLAGALMRLLGGGAFVLVAGTAFLGGRLLMSLGLPRLLSRFWLGMLVLIPTAAVLPPLLFDLAPGRLPWIEPGWLGTEWARLQTLLFGSAGALILTSLLFAVGVLSLTGVSVGATLGVLGRAGGVDSRADPVGGGRARPRPRSRSRGGRARTGPASRRCRARAGAGPRVGDGAPRPTRAAGPLGADARTSRTGALLRRGAPPGRGVRRAGGGARRTCARGDAACPQAPRKRGAGHRRPRRAAPEEAQARAGGVPLQRRRPERALPIAGRLDLLGDTRGRALVRPRLADHELADPREEARRLLGVRAAS